MLPLRPQGWAFGLVAVTAAIICGCGLTSKQQVADSPTLTPPPASTLHTRAPLTSSYPGTNIADRSGREDQNGREDRVRGVAYIDDDDQSPGLLAPPEIQGERSPEVKEPSEVDEPSGEDEGARSPDTAARAAEESMPIDLPTALRLGGANHLQIALARERIAEAAARLDRAEVLWIKSINLGLGYNRHDGRLQETEGRVFDVSRQSLYAGGGPVLGSSPLSGGASGPARLFVDLSLADVYFQPLVARQNVRANQFESTATFNDSLLQVALLYQELVRAQMQVDIAVEAVTNADELARLTENFARAGEGLEADAQRARGAGAAPSRTRRRERARRSRLGGTRPTLAAGPPRDVGRSRPPPVAVESGSGGPAHRRSALPGADPPARAGTASITRRRNAGTDPPGAMAAVVAAPVSRLRRRRIQRRGRQRFFQFRGPRRF